MDFHEFEAQIKERETSTDVKDITAIADFAEKIDLETHLDMVTHEILFSTQPKILPLEEGTEKVRIAILQMPGLRGKYYIEMTNDELKFFRAGYDQPLSTYFNAKSIKPVRDLIRKEFDI